jgi:hypothetical protein
MVDVESHDHRQQDDYEDRREDADHHRHRQLGRQRIGLFLGPREPLVAHVVAIDPQGIGDAGAQVDRLRFVFGADKFRVTFRAIKNTRVVTTLRP